MLTLTHTCESSCCCGERDGGEADMAAITGEIGSKGQRNHRKVQSREETRSTCLCSPAGLHLPCFTHEEEEEEEEAYLSDVFSAINI